MKWPGRNKEKKNTVEVPPGGLYGFKDFSQIIKAIADIKLMQAELLKQSQRIEAIESSAANVSKFTDFQIKANNMFNEFHKDIESLSESSEKQADNIDRIWGMMGRITSRSQELEDHITGEDTQLKRDEYDVEPDIP